MKLLLTSGGITNKSIAKALNELVGKKPSDVKVAYLPTSADVEEGNKDWIIKELLNFWRYGYSWIDLVDPSAADVDWKTRLAAADIVALSGGNTFHLLDQARKTGFDKWLKANLKNKVYVGGSASSILVTPDIGVANIGVFGDKNLPGLKDLSGLNLVDFEIVPHAPGWASYEDAKEYANSVRNKVYVLDDLSAIKVDGQKIDVISEGNWKLLND